MTMIVQVLLHICVHVIGCHILIMTQVIIITIIVIIIINIIKPLMNEIFLLIITCKFLQQRRRRILKNCTLFRTEKRGCFSYCYLTNWALRVQL